MRTRESVQTFSSARTSGASIRMGGAAQTIYYDRIRMGGVQSPVTNFEVVRDCKATGVVDGHHGMGMVIGRRCMQMAIDKARDHGLGMVVARNSTTTASPHTTPHGRRRRHDRPTGTNARPSIAPHMGSRTYWAPTRCFCDAHDEEFHSPTTTPRPSSSVARSSSTPGKGGAAGGFGHQPGRQDRHRPVQISRSGPGTSALAPIGG